MRVHFKMLSTFADSVRVDLARPHRFAAERVGFLACRAAVEPCGIMVIAESYHRVPDEDYLDDASVGAMMGPAAIRGALRVAYRERKSMFHVHMHPHRSMPWFSRTDLRENARFVPDFWNVQPELPHGALVLSTNSLSGLCWLPRQSRPTRITAFSLVGEPLRLVRI